VGLDLLNKGDLDGAEVAFREVIRLAPANPWGHTDLGVVLSRKGDSTGAAACYREAIRLDPQSPRAHIDLGAALQGQGDLAGAVAEFQEALRLDPKDGSAKARLAHAQRWRELLSRLPDIAAGRVEPRTLAEANEIAYFCSRPFQRRYLLAARVYEKALAAEPKLADDPATEHRYNAACCAALAATGKGRDTDELSPAGRAALRAKALAWLRVDRALLQKMLTAGQPADRTMVVRKLSHWLVDADLASVRPTASREGWTAAEVAQWDQLWAKVQATLDEARKPAPRPEKTR
jgi:tetratricopeptide (TPR) repeat protein